MKPLFNKTVMMSDAEYFGDSFAINALMDASIPVDPQKAIAEHNLIRSNLESVGVKIIKVDAPSTSEDGVYTANWALVRGGTAIMSRLPNKRRPEESVARQYLDEYGLKTLTLPIDVERFSGQGDALPCGDIIFTQSPYRTTKSAHEHLEILLGYRVVLSLETLPELDTNGNPVINAVTGWPDSPTYDIDLALAILKWPTANQKGLIAWCPDVFTTESQQLLREFHEVDKIEVSREEAMNAYALNLVSTGQVVVMNAGAPQFQTAIESHDLQTRALELPELKKGGGSIRCTTLTLDNN